MRGLQSPPARRGCRAFCHVQPNARKPCPCSPLAIVAPCAAFSSCTTVTFRLPSHPLVTCRPSPMLATPASAHTPHGTWHPSSHCARLIAGRSSLNPVGHVEHNHPLLRERKAKGFRPLAGAVGRRPVHGAAGGRSWCKRRRRWGGTPASLLRVALPHILSLLLRRQQRASPGREAKSTGSQVLQE